VGGARLLEYATSSYNQLDRSGHFKP